MKQLKEIITGIVIIGLLSVGVSGCGGLEACGISGCGIKACELTEDQLNTVEDNERPSPTTVDQNDLVPRITLTPLPSDDFQGVVFSTPTVTPLPKGNTVKITGSEILVYLYDSMEDMNRAFGIDGSRIPIAQNEIFTTDKETYARIYVKNEGVDYSKKTAILSDGTELIISDNIGYREGYELLTDVMPDYIWRADFTMSDENGDVRFVYDVDKRAFVINSCEDCDLTINLTLQHINNVVITPSLPLSLSPTVAPAEIPIVILTATPTTIPTTTPTSFPKVTQIIILTATPTAVLSFFPEEDSDNIYPTSTPTLFPKYTEDTNVPIVCVEVSDREPNTFKPTEVPEFSSDNTYEIVNSDGLTYSKSLNADGTIVIRYLETADYKLLYPDGSYDYYDLTKDNKVTHYENNIHSDGSVWVEPRWERQLVPLNIYNYGKLTVSCFLKYVWDEEGQPWYVTFVNSDGSESKYSEIKLKWDFYYSCPSVDNVFEFHNGLLKDEDYWFTTPAYLYEY